MTRDVTPVRYQGSRNWKRSREKVGMGMSGAILDREACPDAGDILRQHRLKYPDRKRNKIIPEPVRFLGK